MIDQRLFDLQIFAFIINHWNFAVQWTVGILEFDVLFCFYSVDKFTFSLVG